MTERIWYRSGFKYQLAGDYVTQICVRPPRDVAADFVELTAEGWLTVKKGFAFDGPSVPEWIPMREDTRRMMMRGSCVHDALYELLRQGLIWDREGADNELRRMCLEDGLPADEAESVWRAVQAYGASAADPHHAQAAVSAP